MIQATQFGSAEKKQASKDLPANKSPLRAFVFCMALGSIIGPFVVHQQVIQTIESMSLPVALMTAFIGSSVGGVSGLLIATMADVIFNGRLEEGAYTEEH